MRCFLAALQSGIPKKGSVSKWVQHNVEQEFLELYYFCRDAVAGFPPSVGVKV
jgi:hypothetical protein